MHYNKPFICQYNFEECGIKQMKDKYKKVETKDEKKPDTDTDL